jgi:cobalt-zinc-cadmium efflux system outer membrane protein
MKSHGVFVVLLSLSFCAVFARDGEDRAGLPLESAVQTALLNNPELRAARYTVEQARGRLIQSGRWSNPTLEASGMSDFAFGNKGEAAFSVGIFQEFPITSRLGLARQIGRLDVERAALEVRDHERRLIERVQLTYLQVVESEARVRHWKSIEEKQSGIAADLERRLTAGQGSISERALSIAARAAAWNSLGQAETEAAMEMVNLKSLLGFPAEHSLRLGDDLSSVLTQLSKQTGERPTVMHRPDAELLVLSTQRAELEIRLARAEAWEGIRIGVEYTNERGVDAPEGLGTDQFLGVSVSIPLPLWNSNQGRVAEGQALRDEMQARVDALRLEMSNSLAASLQQVALSKRRLSEIESRSLLALRSAEQEMQKGFEEGRVELRDWLAVRSQLAEVELAQTTAVARLAEAYARLLSITGAHPSIQTQRQPASTKP